MSEDEFMVEFNAAVKNLNEASARIAKLVREWTDEPKPGNRVGEPKPTGSGRVPGQPTRGQKIAAMVKQREVEVPAFLPARARAGDKMLASLQVESRRENLPSVQGPGEGGESPRHGEPKAADPAVGDEPTLTAQGSAMDRVTGDASRAPVTDLSPKPDPSVTFADEILTDLDSLPKPFTSAHLAEFYGCTRRDADAAMLVLLGRGVFHDKIGQGGERTWFDQRKAKAKSEVMSPIPIPLPGGASLDLDAGVITSRGESPVRATFKKPLVLTIAAIIKNADKTRTFTIAQAAEAGGWHDVSLLRREVSNQAEALGKVGIRLAIRHGALYVEAL